MKIFFDTEFTGLVKDTDLISIGLISEDGRKFYAEINDYDKSKLDDWLIKNVVNNLFLDFHHNVGERAENIVEKDNTIISYDYYIRDNKEAVSTELKRWLKHFDSCEFVSDVSHFDFVLFIDLTYKSALNFPENMCPSCHDINQDISKFLNISEHEAFNYSREDFIDFYVPQNKVYGRKHNSLYDAEVIKVIYDFLSKNI